MGSIREGFDSYPELKMASVFLSPVAKRTSFHEMGFVWIDVYQVSCSYSRKPVRMILAKKTVVKSWWPRPPLPSHGILLFRSEESNRKIAIFSTSCHYIRFTNIEFISHTTFLKYLTLVLSHISYVIDNPDSPDAHFNSAIVVDPDRTVLFFVGNLHVRFTSIITIRVRYPYVIDIFSF